MADDLEPALRAAIEWACHYWPEFGPILDQNLGGPFVRDGDELHAPGSRPGDGVSVWFSGARRRNLHVLIDRPDFRIEWSGEVPHG
jgi:hypothetical protein